jgi:hypothetical protein
MFLFSLLCLLGLGTAVGYKYKHKILSCGIRAIYESSKVMQLFKNTEFSINKILLNIDNNIYQIPINEWRVLNYYIIKEKFEIIPNKTTLMVHYTKKGHTYCKFMEILSSEDIELFMENLIEIKLNKNHHITSILSATYYIHNNTCVDITNFIQIFEDNSLLSSSQNTFHDLFKLNELFGFNDDIKNLYKNYISSLDESESETHDDPVSYIEIINNIGEMNCFSINEPIKFKI